MSASPGRRGEANFMNLIHFAKRKPNKLFLFYFLSFFLVILVPPIDQWISQITAARKPMLWLPTRTFVNQDGNPYSIATIVVKLPVAYAEITGYIAIHFNEDKLNDYLRAMDSGNNTRVYLTADNGVLVSAYEIRSPYYTDGHDHTHSSGRKRGLR